MAKAVLLHHFDNHSFCGEWCKRKNVTKIEKSASDQFHRSLEKDKALFDALEKTIERFIAPKQPKAERHWPENAKFITRAHLKIRYTWEDFRFYLVDILRYDKDAISKKTAAFLKRNIFRVSHFLHHIWIELKKIGKGMRLLKDDVKYGV